MTPVERMNTLFRDSVKANFEAFETAQRHNRAITLAWLEAFEAGQGVVRELTLGNLERMLEAQRLWVDYVQETSEAGMENFTTVAKAGLNEAKPSRANTVRPEPVAK